MKRFAILTAGESLLETYSDEFFEDYDLVFAVNDAGRHFRHHWLCFVDECIKDSLPEFVDPVFGYLTSFERFGSLDPNKAACLQLFRKKEERLLDAGIDTVWKTRCGYTFPCALWEARLEDSDAQVDIFGLDCQGKNTRGASYIPERWKMELPWVAYAWPKNARVFGRISESDLQWIADHAPEPEEAVLN